MKKAVIIFGSPRKNSIQSFISMLRFIGFEETDQLIACDLDKDNKPLVSENKRLMQKAYELGKNLLA